MLTENGILLDGDKFTDISVFDHDDSTCILLDMDDVKIDVGKLAIWRLETHSVFGGTWLSDFRVNSLGMTEGESHMPESTKPEAKIIGADGNVFNILGIASKALKRAGLHEQVTEMRERVTSSGSYDNALAIITEYVEPVEVDDPVQSTNMEFGG